MGYMIAVTALLLMGMLFRILMLLERLVRCAQILRRRGDRGISAEEGGAGGQESEGERQAREAIEKFNLGVADILSYDAGKKTGL